MSLDRPVGDNATFLEQAAPKQRGGGSPVISAGVGIHMRGATELGDERGNRLTPSIAYIRFDGGDDAIERAEQDLPVAYLSATARAIRREAPGDRSWCCGTGQMKRTTAAPTIPE